MKSDGIKVGFCHDTSLIDERVEIDLDLRFGIFVTFLRALRLVQVLISVKGHS